MSVNDELPWIPPVLELIRQAVARDVPVLGHCLGGQLMSKALGGTVSRAPVKEIGWGEVHVAHDAVAQAWFGPALRCIRHVPVARRDLHHSAGRHAGAVQPLVPEPGLRAGPASGPAVPHRDDRGAGAQLVPDRRSGDRAQPRTRPCSRSSASHRPGARLLHCRLWPIASTPLGRGLKRLQPAGLAAARAEVASLAR